MRGAGTDEVVTLLGNPIDKRTNPARPGEVEWIFERNVHFSAVVQSEQNLRGTGSSAYQRGRYVETARLRFRNGQVSGISIRRIPDDGILQPEDLDESAVLRVLLKRNQGLLFDGRILHRGSATRCARAPVMYHLFERPFG